MMIMKIGMILKNMLIMRIEIEEEGERGVVDCPICICQYFITNLKVTNMKGVKGIVHNFFFYRSNLIFWIVMGCGIADLGRRGL